MISRRGFLRSGIAGTCAFCTGYTPFVTAVNASGMDEEEFPAIEAMYYKKLPDIRVECELCPRACQVADLERGYCGVRENRNGKYYTLVHSRVCSRYADPIEKKPLFHYLPGTKAYSIATAGCNIECKFCQNWQISQFRPEQIDNIKLTPEEVIRFAQEKKCDTIAYTYSEPVVFYEYMYDTARVGKREGVGSVMISNGYIKKEPLVELCKELSAVKIDFKAFTEKFYKETCSGELKPILETLVTLKEIGIWFEIVMLVIPTLNDSDKELNDMCSWIYENLGPDVPVHFSRFHSTYKIKNLPPTPTKTLEKARNIAIESGLNFAYTGNVPGHPGESTYCPDCKEVLIKRVGYTILQYSLNGNKCGNCKHPIPGVWH
ncbi:MAG: AmmeMemoRadiSam system radical SAM enzyme [Candidatus Scalindua sp.]|nr:AmmeMemoRadiSam system radical SAM enzyme [Candidatus Scalindua sp.]